MCIFLLHWFAETWLSAILHKIEKYGAGDKTMQWTAVFFFHHFIWRGWELGVWEGLTDFVKMKLDFFSPAHILVATGSLFLPHSEAVYTLRAAYKCHLNQSIRLTQTLNLMYSCNFTLKLFSMPKKSQFECWSYTFVKVLRFSPEFTYKSFFF